MAKRKKLSTIEKEYNKQRRRVQNYVNSMLERGYEFEKQPLPNVPKKITRASINRLKTITPKSLYKKSSYTFLSGQKISGTERRKEELRADKEAGLTYKKKKQRLKPLTETKSHFEGAMNLPSITDVVLSNVEDLIARFPDGNDVNWQPYQAELHERHKNMLEGMLNAQIRLAGRNVVALRMQRSGEDITRLCEAIMYGDSDDERFQVDIMTFASIIKGEALSVSESREIEELASQYEE